jgi:excisionase family DNA binding protein
MASAKSVLRSSQSAKLKMPRPVGPGAKSAAPVESLESAVLTVLKTVRHHQPKATSQNVAHERTVRMRRQGEPDRRYLLAYAVDPDDSEAVIFRVRPASGRDLGLSRAPMLSTQQVAEQLNVSRPYIVKLVDEGVFQGVERTQAGHRRIPAVEVERVRRDMQTSRRAALNNMDKLTSDLRTKELEAARTASKRRWIKNT